MPQNRDILWKALIESIFDDLLRFLYPNIDQEVNLMQPVVYMDKELAAIVPGSEEEMTTRVVDKLVKVQLKDKKFALIHVEIQGRTEEKKRHLLRGKDREKRWFEGKLFVLRKLYGNGQLEDRKLQAVLVFMERYLPLEDAEIRRQFSKHVDQLTNKKNTMDMIELELQLTRQESEKAARESVVRELLIHSRFSDKRIAAITKISSRQVAKMRKQIRSKKPA
jgi:hypothetical protein